MTHRRQQTQAGKARIGRARVTSIELDEPIEDRTLAAGLSVEVDRRLRHPSPSYYDNIVIEVKT